MLNSKLVPKILSYLVLANVAIFGLVLQTMTSNKTSSEEIFLVPIEMDIRVRKLRVFFEKHNSPLASHAAFFVKTADKYGLDYRLIPSIAGVESTFAKRYPVGTFNAYGWNSGAYKFQSWEDSIEHVASYLSREYVARGFDTVAEIARKYAPPSKSWANGVMFFMRKIEATQV